MSQTERALDEDVDDLDNDDVDVDVDGEIEVDAPDADTVEPSDRAALDELTDVDDSVLDEHGDLDDEHDEIDQRDHVEGELDDGADDADDIDDVGADDVEAEESAVDEAPGAAAATDPDGAADELGVSEDLISDDVLEELRRADIDGPTVELLAEDDSSTGMRRPQRATDYDDGPIPIPTQLPRVLGQRPRVRRVTRVVRHVDPWSVFKIALVGNMVLYLIVLTAGVLLWNVAHATGTVDNVERFFESFGWSEFEFNGGEIFHNAWIGGLFVVIGLTGLAVLFATLFNLITDLVGGMRFTVLEEEVVETRPSPLRRFVERRLDPDGLSSDDRRAASAEFDGSSDDPH